MQQRRARAVQSVRAGLPRIRWFHPILLTLALALSVLAGLYRLPLDRHYSVATGTLPLFGGLGAEHNATLSYRYTSGDTLFLVPHVGAAPQIVRFSLAGPSLSHSRETQVYAGKTELDLGTVRGLRIYHMLIPTDDQGSLRLHIISSAGGIAGDQRLLGVLIAQASISSTTLLPLPLFVLLSALLSATVLFGSVQRRWNNWLACGGVLLVALGLGFARGRVELPPLWWQSGVALFALALAALLRMRWFATARPIYAVGAIFGFWRLGLWLVAAFGLWFSQLIAQFGALLTRDGNEYDRTAMLWDTLVQSWVQWDSEFYTKIATLGYRFQGERWPSIAFFPLYPLLIKLITPFTTGHVEIVGVLISNLALLAALLLLYHLLESDFGRSTALWTLIFVLCIPTSFFFGAMYSESLALLLTVAALSALRRKRWWLAGAAGLLLALTRVPGVLIAPVLALCYLQSLGWQWRNLRWPLLAVGLPPLGLLGFMAFQWWKFATPFAFMQAQQAWENALSPPWVLPLNLYTMITTKSAWPNLVFQALFYLLFVVLMLVSLRRLPLAYGLTTLFLLVPPLLSSWTWSVSRHMLIGVGAYIILAQWAQRRWVRFALLAVFVPLLILTTLLFVNGWWIA